MLNKTNKNGRWINQIIYKITYSIGFCVGFIRSSVARLTNQIFYRIIFAIGFCVGFMKSPVAKRVLKIHGLQNSYQNKKKFQPKFLTFILPKKYRDEFLGDYLEQRFKMKEENQPNWFINLVSLGQIFFVVVAMLKIHLWDWIDPEKEKNK